MFESSIERLARAFAVDCSFCGIEKGLILTGGAGTPSTLPGLVGELLTDVAEQDGDRMGLEA